MYQFLLFRKGPKTLSGILYSMGINRIKDVSSPRCPRCYSSPWYPSSHEPFLLLTWFAVRGALDKWSRLQCPHSPPGPLGQTSPTCFHPAPGSCQHLYVIQEENSQCVSTRHCKLATQVNLPKQSSGDFFKDKKQAQSNAHLKQISLWASSSVSSRFGDLI